MQENRQAREEASWLNRTLLIQLKCRKVVYREQKQEWATTEEYRSVAWACKDRMKKIKAWLELMRGPEGNNKGFNTFGSNIRKAKENVGLAEG